VKAGEIGFEEGDDLLTCRASTADEQPDEEIGKIYFRSKTFDKIDGRRVFDFDDGLMYWRDHAYTYPIHPSLSMAKP
jgi:hypothetical protein